MTTSFPQDHLSRARRRANHAKRIVLTLFSAVSVYTAPAYAGSAANATIVQITFFEGKNGLGQDGTVMIWTNVADSGKPNCAQGTWQNTFSINAGTTGGAALVAAAISAQAQGLLVNIQGAGTCTLNGSGEDLAWMSVE